MAELSSRNIVNVYFMKLNKGDHSRHIIVIMIFNKIAIFMYSSNFLVKHIVYVCLLL